MQKGLRKTQNVESSSIYGFKVYRTHSTALCITSNEKQNIIFLFNLKAFKMASFNFSNVEVYNLNSVFSFIRASQVFFQPSHIVRLSWSSTDVTDLEVPV